MERGRSRTGRTRMLVVAVASVVLGILGMHALGTHAMMDAAGHTTTAASGHVSGHGDEPSAAMDTSPASRDKGEAGGTGMGEAMMLCAAMIAAAGALLLVLRLLRRTPRPWVLLPRGAATTVRRWVTARLGTGPPPVWEFSVIRC